MSNSMNASTFSCGDSAAVAHPDGNGVFGFDRSAEEA
jgi:hypothetical protein